MSEARWLTPNAPAPHKFFTRRLLIPAASDFLGLVNGALFELCQVHNWQQDGDMTPQETADYFLELWRQYLQNDNEPPAWDTPENVDGQPEQPWYEQLEDWIIQGFLAVTFTPLAALVYQTTVPKLRVAIRTGNLGALFKVLINGVEVWTGDSYGPITDIIEQVFDLSAETEPATVQIVHMGQNETVVGDAKLEVVRGDAVAQMVQTILRGDPGGCGIQWSLDNGGSWNTIDLALCIATLADGQIDQAIRDGRLAVPTGQPGPQLPPAPGTCTTYHVKLDGNQQWRLPSGLGYGDTVQVLNMSGGWSDNGAAWWCPTGQVYLLGGCSDVGRRHDTGDVLASAWHMALVMQVDTTWYDTPTAAFQQLSGTDPLPVVFQANDGSLSDNTGSIEFDVEVCSNGWSHTFDFTTGMHGWEFNPVFSSPPGYQDGDGIHEACVEYGGINYQQIDIVMTIPSTRLLRFTATGDYTLGSPGSSVYYGCLGSGGWIFQETSPIPNGTDTYPIEVVDSTTTSLRLIINTQTGGCGGNANLRTLTISGVGTDPF